MSIQGSINQLASAMSIGQFLKDPKKAELESISKQSSELETTINKYDQRIQAEEFRGKMNMQAYQPEKAATNLKNMQAVADKQAVYDEQYAKLAHRAVDLDPSKKNIDRLMAVKARQKMRDSIQNKYQQKQEFEQFQKDLYDMGISLGNNTELKMFLDERKGGKK